MKPNKLFLAPFILFSLLLVFIIKIPKILSYYLYQISLSYEGIDNPFIMLVVRFLFVCVGTRDLRVVSYCIDTLVLKNRGKYLRYFATSPFPLEGKTNASSRGSKKDFWRRCRGDLGQAETYQVPIITLIPRITLFAIRLSFSSPPLLK